jgi:hypothetical protein
LVVSFKGNGAKMNRLEVNRQSSSNSDTDSEASMSWVGSW